MSITWTQPSPVRVSSLAAHHAAGAAFDKVKGRVTSRSRCNQAATTLVAAFLVPPNVVCDEHVTVSHTGMLHLA